MIDLTNAEFDMRDGELEYAQYGQFDITLKKVWKYGKYLCLCSEKGQGFGIAKTMYWDEAQYEALVALQGQQVRLVAARGLGRENVKWLRLPAAHMIAA